MVRPLRSNALLSFPGLVSHRLPINWWREAGYTGWEAEIRGQQSNLVERAGIPKNEIKGFRAPFLQVGADRQFQVLEDLGFLYESSLPTSIIDPPLWPYTLDYDTVQECMIGPCPTWSYPGLWEVPLVQYTDVNGVFCTMPDDRRCDNGGTFESTLKMLEDNFLRHYNSNRSPFPIFIHSSFFRIHKHSFKAVETFLDNVLARDDVYLTTVSKALDWIRHPVALKNISSLSSWGCGGRGSARGGGG